MAAIDPAVGGLFAATLTALFAWSAALKLADVGRFVGVVADYRLIPRRLEKGFAWAVPVCELACAAGLCWRSTRTLAAGGLVLLLGLFTAAIAINLGRGRTTIDCGCFGPTLRQPLTVWLLARNAGLLMMAALVAVPAGTRPLDYIDFVTIGCGAATVLTLYVSVNYALVNMARSRLLKGF